MESNESSTHGKAGFDRLAIEGRNGKERKRRYDDTTTECMPLAMRYCKFETGRWKKIAIPLSN